MPHPIELELVKRRPIVQREVGRRIAEMRKARDWELEDLASCAHRAVRIIQLWEAGRNFELDTLLRVSLAMEAPLEEFFKKPKSMKSDPRGQPPGPAAKAKAKAAASGSSTKQPKQPKQPSAKGTEQALPNVPTPGTSGARRSRGKR